MPFQFKYLLINLSCVPMLINWGNRNRLLVLTYHGIYDGPRRPDLLPETFVHVDDMAKQLKMIKKRYSFITPNELQASLDGKSFLPVHSVLITFDDGYESFFRLAIPVLDSLGIRAIVFIPTRYLEQHEPFWSDLVWLFIKQSPPYKLAWLMDALELKYNNINIFVNPTFFIEKMKIMFTEHRDKIVSQITNIMSTDSTNYAPINDIYYPMTDEQVKKLSILGTTFGGHTHTHTILTAMPDSSAETEIKKNKNKLEALTGKACNFFTYPNGRERDFDKIHKELLKQAGYKAAFSLTQRRSLVYEDPMDISRITVVPEDSVTSLSFHCTGFRSTLNQAYRKVTLRLSKFKKKLQKINC